MSRHECCGSNEEHYTECPVFGTEPSGEEETKEPLLDSEERFDSEYKTD